MTNDAYREMTKELPPELKDEDKFREMQAREAEEDQMDYERQLLAENLKPKPWDKVFHDSPDAGEPDCFCSRCGNLIGEDEIPIRLYVDEGRGGELRYCGKCMEG